MPNINTDEIATAIANAQKSEEYCASIIHRDPQIGEVIQAVAETIAAAIRRQDREFDEKHFIAIATQK